MLVSGSFLLNRFLFFLAVKFFIILCTGCIGGNGQNFDLDDNFYEAKDLLSFDPLGSYSTRSFALAFSRSSVFDGMLSERSARHLSLSSIVLSTDIESTVVNFFNLRFSRARGYRMEYMVPDPYNKTKKIKVSGWVIVPLASQALPLLVYFHPTLLQKSTVPSLAPLSLLSMDPIEDYRLMTIFLALQGYIVFAPDYVGYGSSEDVRHPYLYKKSVAQTAASMLHSTAEALDQEGIPFQRDLFIMGYSQGGHGALAFAEAMQNSSMGFELQAVSAGGGPYDMLYTVREQLDKKTVWRVLLTLLLQSYSYIYNWDLNDILKKEKYADIVDSSFRYESMVEATRDLPDKPRSLFHSQFIRDIYERRGNNPFQFSLEENSVYDWTPEMPVFLFHAREDQIVPYKNMEIAYNSFNRRRANVKRKNCSLRKVEDFIDIVNELGRKRSLPTEPDHINCSFVFFLETGDYFFDHRD